MNPGRVTGVDVCSATPPPAVLWQRLRAGVFDAHVQAWLRDAACKADQDPNGTPLDYYLRRPTPKQKRRERCRFFLAEALQLIEGSSRTARFAGLAHALDQFIARGPWREWQALPSPPGWADPLQCALFAVAQNLEPGDGRSARQIARLIESAEVETDFPVELSRPAGETGST